MSSPTTPPDAVLVETVRVDASDGPADALVGRPPGEGPLPAVLVYTDAYGIRPSVNAYAKRLASHG